MTRFRTFRLPSFLNIGSRQTNVPLNTPALGVRTIPLRWELVVLVAGALLPVVLFAVVMVYRLSIQEQAASERRALLAARNLSNTVEREVSSTARTLQALSESEQLDQGNLQLFHSEARRVAKTQMTWLTVILLAPDGRQLLNTRQPFGTTLPRATELASLQRVVETRQPVVGDLAAGPLQGNLAFPIRVPVIRNGQLKYILTAVITPQALASVVQDQAPADGEWTRTVVDGRGIVVARTRNPERFVGQQGTPSFLQRIRATTEGVYRDITLEGVRVYVAFSRMSDSRWTVAVTVPVEVIEGPAQQATGLTIGAGVMVLLLGGGGAIFVSQRISRSITSVTLAAEALAKGEHPSITPSSITEIDALGAALMHSADLLFQRQQERDEHLAQAEAARIEAEAANRLKDEFLITISHELRTPLNAILGWATLLGAGQLDEARKQSAIAIIERNARAQARLVNDLLDTSRIITGKLQLDFHPVALNSVIAGAIDAVRHAAEAKGIQLKPDLTDTSLVWGDQNRLQQVVWNLLSNAVKFTPEGGRVEVSLKAGDAHAYIAVQDSGRGIRTEFLPYVFDRFRQSDGSTTREFGGLGLGLAIARHLVEMHGGTIQVDSPGEGLGATFTVQLPLLKTKYQAPEPSSRLPSFSNLSPLQDVRALVVDDETDARDLVAFVLEQAGAMVTVAPSAIAALDHFSTAPFDVLVSDIGMPQMDGYDLMRHIRAMSVNQKTPIVAIALTAYAGERDQQQSFDAGFQHHMAKPVQPDELVKAIAGLLNRM